MVVHFFAASWSPECTQMEGVINELAKDSPKIKFYKVSCLHCVYLVVCTLYPVATNIHSIQWELPKKLISRVTIKNYVVTRADVFPSYIIQDEIKTKELHRHNFAAYIN